jgi:hypothetical protein
MAKKRLIVVHGMGQHSDASLKEEVVGAFTKAFSLYDSLKGKSVEEHFDIIPVVYNQFFDDYRAKLASHTGGIANRLAEIDGSLPLSARAVQEINDIEASIGTDSFFATHWLDVILYRLTLLCEPIRLAVAETIATAIAAVGSPNVHVLGHSLGTAVLHDALAKSYGPENIRTEGGQSLNLSVKEHRLGGVHLIANVSRALQTFVKVGSSVVRPGELGCTSVFVEYRHRLDPVTKVKPFQPTNNGSWVPQSIWKSVYILAEPSSVTAANVHALRHYLVDPMVHLVLFRSLFNYRPKKKEQEDGEAVFLETTVEGKAKALQAAFGDLQLNDQDSLKALLEAAKGLKDMALGFGEEF